MNRRTPLAVEVRVHSWGAPPMDKVKRLVTHDRELTHDSR
jgi:hypothetical protein